MPLSDLAAAILALAMIGAIVLLIAGVRLASSGGERRRGLLMIVAALVIVANVLIWTI